MVAIEVRLHMPGANAPLLIGDIVDPRVHGIDGLGGDEQRTVEIARPLRAAQVSVFDRGNRQESLTLRAAKLHPDIAAAFLYWLKHPSEVPIKVDAEFIQSSARAWLNGCAVQTVARVERPGGGLTTIFQYQLVGGAWSNVQATN